MSVDQVSKSLWTPEGPVDLREKDVILVTDPMERVTFARFHEIAHKYHFTVTCQRCDHAIVGQNNDSTKILSVACRCREWRFVK
jgi:hypothetical protein